MDMTELYPTASEFDATETMRKRRDSFPRANFIHDPLRGGIHTQNNDLGLRPLPTGLRGLADLLYGPCIAVRILEEHERAPGEFLHVADIDTSPQELGARRAGVWNNELKAPCGPGSLSTKPVPMAIEHADPGGVSCTNRNSSFTWWS